MEEGLMSKVVAAIDNSAAAAPVLIMARALAPPLGADVEAVHVSDEPGRTAASSARFYDVPLETRAGDPLDVLTRIAEDDAVVAFALGASRTPHRRRPLGHL